MADKTKYAMGVDLGGTNIKLGIVSNKGKLVKKISIKTQAEKGRDVVIENIKKGIQELLKSKSTKNIK